MSIPLVFVLVVLYLFLTWHAFQRGDTAMAIVYLVTGMLWAASRLIRAKKPVAK